MTRLRICIAGATGWVGVPLCKAGAEPYIQGTLLAIRKVNEHAGLIHGLDELMR